MKVEIKPGFFIEVHEKTKLQMEGRALVAARRKMIGTTPEGGAVRYTLEQLDDASAIADKKGLCAAAEITGVKFWSIVQRRRELKRQGVLPREKPRKGSRYTLEQKQQCVRMAMQIVARGRPKTKAFEEAGRLLNMNGSSIHWMHSQLMIPGVQPSSPPRPRIR